MKKTIRLSVIAVITIMLAMTGIAEARKGDSSSTSSSSKSSTSSKPSRSTSSYISKPSRNTTRISKDPDVSSRSKTNSSFLDAAKTKEAKTAWQERVRKTDDTRTPDVSTRTTVPVVAPQNDTRDLERQLADLQNQFKAEKKRKKADKISQQLAAIEKQIADARRQQQAIAVAQTAAQIAINNRTQTPAVNNNLPTKVVEKPVQSNNGGTSWFSIFLIIGAIALVYFWLRKGSSSTTNYRL